MTLSRSNPTRPATRRKWPFGLAAAGVAVVAAAVWVKLDYEAWTRLGAGGIQGSFKGWLRTTRLRLQMKHSLDLTGLLAMQGSAGDAVHLPPLPRRSTVRPRVGAHPIPHRQIDQRAHPELAAALKTAFDSAVADNADHVRYALSFFERHTRAVTCLEGASDPLGGASRGEIGHIHDLDGSMHMILSPTDTIAAIEGGWGELHGLAGRAANLPPNYLMVYAPQRVEDVAVAAQLLRAAIAYMTGAGGSIPAQTLEPA